MLYKSLINDFALGDFVMFTVKDSSVTGNKQCIGYVIRPSVQLPTDFPMLYYFKIIDNNLKTVLYYNIDVISIDRHIKHDCY